MLSLLDLVEEKYLVLSKKADMIEAYKEHDFIGCKLFGDISIFVWKGNTEYNFIITRGTTILFYGEDLKIVHIWEALERVLPEKCLYKDALIKIIILFIQLISFIVLIIFLLAWR